jgi:leader peptidase (prepilin peptidase)/N-methyltransferase
MIDPVILLILFIFGISIGSFLNVVIFRLPKNMSLFFPGSHCFSCKTPVKIIDNIPVFGYFILGGKCRSCSTNFSARYALVEFFSGVLTCVIFLLYGFSQYFFIYTFITYALIAITFIDLDHFIIPNGFIILGLLSIAIIYFFGFSPLHWEDGAMGALIFGGFLFFLGVFGEFILKKESIGFGDVKLGLVLGGLIGVKFSILTLYLSFFSAGLAIIILMLSKKLNTASGQIPFGPYISAGTLLTILTGTQNGDNLIIDWYIRTMF